MSNCRQACDIPVMGMGTQSKNNKLYISITDPIEGCVNIRTDTYESISSTLGTITPTFEPFDKPTDQLNCPEPLCITTGMLNFGFLDTNPPEGTPQPTATTLVYLDDESAIDYATGVISKYFKLYAPGRYNLTTTITDQCNGNDVVLNATFEGHVGEVYPKYILVQHALDEANTMLSPSDCGLKLSLSVLPQDLTSSAQRIGISSISMVKDKSEFEQNDVIVITCVDELDFPNEVDLTDPTCLGQSPDDTSISAEMTVTAQQVTGNFLRLNPLLHKLDDTQTFAPECMARTITTFEINGVSQSAIRLPGFYGDECSFVTAYLPGCDANEGYLVYNSIKNSAKPDLYNFKVLTDELTGEKYMVFSDSYLGLVVTIVYPKEVDAVVYEATADFVEGRRIRLMSPYEYKNGSEGYILSESAFCTAFPHGWSTTEDTPMEFTFVFMTENGRYYKRVVYDKNAKSTVTAK